MSYYGHPILFSDTFLLFQPEKFRISDAQTDEYLEWLQQGVLKNHKHRFHGKSQVQILQSSLAVCS